MAKKKRKKGKRGRRKMTALQRKYFGKSTRKRKHTRKVANKMARRKGRKGSRRRGGGRRRSSGGGRGMLGKVLPSTNTLLDAAGGAVYGKLEAMAKADANNVLNKIPRPIAQLGYTGGAALVLHLLNGFFLKNKYVGHLVNGMTVIAGYQMGRAGALPTDATTIFTISGDGDDMGALDDEDMRQLAGEMGYDDGDDMGGLDADNPAGVAGLDADNPGGVAGLDAYAGDPEL